MSFIKENVCGVCTHSFINTSIYVCVIKLFKVTLDRDRQLMVPIVGETDIVKGNSRLLLNIIFKTAWSFYHYDNNIHFIHPLGELRYRSCQDVIEVRCLACLLAGLGT